MTSKGIIIVFAISSWFLAANVNAQSFYNVMKYGAKNDSIRLSTDAIRRTLMRRLKLVAAQCIFQREDIGPGQFI
jgi:hypothetical protein